MGITIRLLFLIGSLGIATFTASADPAKAYVIQTLAGSDFSGDGGSALAAVFSQTEGIAADVAGNIYVADAADNRVRKIAPDGTIQPVAGTGVAGFSGDGGSATSAQLAHPYGIAVDAVGNLYIADFGNARVRKVGIDGNIRTVAGGGIMVPGPSTEGSPAVSMQLIQPRNVAVDPDGTLYVSDFGAHRVYVISPAGIFNTLAGTGNKGLSGDNTAASLAQLNSPAGVASDSNGTLYIADSGNNRVRKVLHGVISTVYNVTGPTGVAVSASGTLYVAATSYVGTQFRAIGGLPSALDVAVDRAGNVYASTGQYVRKVTSDGKVSTMAGSGAARYFGGDNGPANAARMNGPSGVAVDDMGNWYVADAGNHRIRKITPAGIISTIAGTGDPGSSGDGGLASQAQLNSPRSVAIDAQHNLYIADSGNNRVRRITPAGSIFSVTTDVNDPEYVTVDRDGSVYIADAGNNRVVKVTSSGVPSVISQVLKPAGLAVDSSGNVFVSEVTRISKITPAGAVSTVIDGLKSPRGLALTQVGDLLFAEAGANAIRRWSSGALTTIAGTGAAGFSGDGGAALAAQLNTPSDVVVDLTGVVWVADSANNRIRNLTPTLTADVVATASIVHAATLAPGPIAPGEIVSIFGSGFDTDKTQLLFDGKPATIFYASATQINALAPSSLAPGNKTEITIAVNGKTVADFTVDVAASVPGIFTVGNGTGPAAAVNQDGSINSAANPADRGSIVSLFATGEGSNVSAVSVKMGAYAADVLYAGPAPGFPGLMQINAQVPAGFAPGGILPLVLTVGNTASQAGVTIAVR